MNTYLAKHYYSPTGNNNQKDQSDQIRNLRWTPYDQDRVAQGWYYSTYQTAAGTQCNLQIDTLSGAFLVNGKSCNSLPNYFLAHPLYVRLFGKWMGFVVSEYF